MKRQPFRPEQKSVPVDEKDDPQGDEGILQGEPRQAGRCQGHPFTGKRTEQDPAIPLAVINVDLEVFVGDVQFEVELEVQF